MCVGTRYAAQNHWASGVLATVADISPSRLVFVDETGTHTSMTRDYARSPIGERVVGIVPRNRGVILTVVGAVALDGVRAMFESGMIRPTRRTGDEPA